MATLTDDVSPVPDDRPIAVRRKRRSSSAIRQSVEPTDVAGIQVSIANPNESTGSADPAKTPGKPKKRVRFSDPTPQATAPSSSTGLTPHLSRTSFATRARDARDSSPPLRPQARRQRLSLPPSISTALPSPSLSPSPSSIMPLSGEIQFAPLRQTLDSRVKRRLRRNNLSEELNNIEAEKRTEAQWRQEVEGLKEELAEAKEAISGRGDGPSVEDEHATRIQQLEHEIHQLKQEDPQPPSIFEDPSRDQEGDIYVDETAEDFVDIDFNESSALRDRTPKRPEPIMTHAVTQASFHSPSDPEVLREARLSLEYLFPGEIALGLVPEDPKPLLDVMLERLQILKTQLLVTEDTLSTNQMQESNLRTQFNAVLEQLDRSRKYAEKIAGKHANEKAKADAAQVKLSAFEENANDGASQIFSLQQENAEKDLSIQKLQTALSTYRVEVGKLEELINRVESEHQEAISAVRHEMDEAVADLECHVVAETNGRREAESALESLEGKMTSLRSRESELLSAVAEKDRTISDLQSAFSDERTSHERSLGTLNAHVGQLTTDLSSTKQNLKESYLHRSNAERACTLLALKLEEEKAAGLRAVAAVQAELARCSSNAETIKVAHESESKRRGDEVAEHKGLLTPITTTRFRDVEMTFFGDDMDSYRNESDGAKEHVGGYVEVGRGKHRKLREQERNGRRKRPDSGIGVLEEDEDESMYD